MAVTISYEADGRVLVATVDNPPVNALSHAVRSGLKDAAERAANEDAVEAMVVAAAGRTFIAGADIREFGKPMQEPGLGEVIDVIEALDKPVVAAMFGTTLGGGLEVAHGCHYRVAQAGSKFGLPEVKLGLLPGAGGTQRMPRLAGVAFSLEAITSGNHYPVEKGLEVGIVDQVVDGDVVAAAVKFAVETAIPKGVRKTRDQVVPDKDQAAEIIAAFKKKSARSSRGYFAPEQCIACVEASVSMDYDAAIVEERERFMACMANPQSRAMQHIFFAERQTKIIPDLSRDTPVRSVKSVGVLGSGTMGGGIAMCFANAGIPVTLIDINEEMLQKGLGVVRSNYERSAKRGKLTTDQVEHLMGLIKPSTDYADLSDVDLVIEAVIEQMDIKKKVFETLDSVCKQGAILATNTSYLNIDEIAAATKRPEDVIGLHFFSPANVMRLLEIVRAEKTADDVLATSLAIAKGIKKTGVVARVCPGFIGNRMVKVYGQQAYKMASRGTAPETIDNAMYDFGLAMGPFAMGDMAGLDIGYMSRKASGSYDESVYSWVDRLVEMGRKGQKTGAGIYTYKPGDRTPNVDPMVMDMIREEAQARQIGLVDCTPEEIVERCMLALINEGAQILEEGMAIRASDIDIVYVNGYGFPPYRGGPMHYADYLGLDIVRTKLEALAKEDPAYWTVSPLITRLADAGETFAQFDRRNSKG